jgi:hypothetical protein
MRWRDFWRVGGIVAEESVVAMEVDLDLDLGLRSGLIFERVGVVSVEMVGKVAIL